MRPADAKKAERRRQATAQARQERLDAVLAHVDHLVAQGMALKEISRCAGIDQTLIFTWRKGAAAPGPASAAKVLAVQPDSTPEMKSVLFDHVLAEEWPFMLSVLGDKDSALARLADAYKLSESYLLDRLREAGIYTYQGETESCPQN